MRQCVTKWKNCLKFLSSDDMKEIIWVIGKWGRMFSNLHVVIKLIIYCVLRAILLCNIHLQTFIKIIEGFFILVFVV
jgi:hypothetical protein